MKNIFLNIILLLSCSVLGLGQPTSEKQWAFLENVYGHYAQATSFSMDIEVSAFDENQNLVMPMQQSRSVKSRYQYLIATPAVINLVTDYFQLIVDHGNQIIQLNPLSEQAKKELRVRNFEQVFPAREVLVKDSTISISETFDQFVIHTKDQLSGNKCIYTFDKNRKVLNQVDYYLPGNISGQPAHVQIRYLNVSVNEEILDREFSMEKFLKIKAEDRRLTADYKHYTLIDNTKAK